MDEECVVRKKMSETFMEFAAKFRSLATEIEELCKDCGKCREPDEESS